MTLRSMFKQFGHGFYAIGILVRLGLQCLKNADMQREYETLKTIIYSRGYFCEKWIELSGK